MSTRQNERFRIVLSPLVIFFFFYGWHLPCFGSILYLQQPQKLTLQSQVSHRLRKELINILDMSIKWGGRDIHISRTTWEQSDLKDATGKAHDDFKDDKTRMAAIDELVWKMSGAEDTTRRVFASYSTHSALNNGITIAFPDVCKSPAPPSALVPIPYPGISKPTDTKKGSKETKIEVKADTIQSGTIVKSVQKHPITVTSAPYTRQQEIVRYRKAMKELLLRKE
jgi:hypothetical protein